MVVGGAPLGRGDLGSAGRLHHGLGTHEDPGERAIGGSTWAAFFEGQTQPWFVQGMQWRMIFGVVMTAGLVLLLWDMLTIGRGETRPAKAVHALPAPVG